MPLPLFQLTAATQLAGSLVLALFFVLLSRHDRRPYLRDWTFAWVAQLLAVAALVASLLGGFPTLLGAALFFSAGHGILLVAAAQSYVRGLGFRRAHVGILLPVAVWSGWAPFFLGDSAYLPASHLGLLAGAHVAAAAVLWPARRPGTMGLSLSTQVLGLLGLLYGLLAGLALLSERAPELRLYLEVAPLLVLVMQMLLALGMVLAAMEAAQAALADTNAALEEAQHRLEAIAETDPLTGCLNRRAFRELVDELRAGEAEPHGVVLVLDMDGLKDLNDRKGHAAGDEAIRGVAAALRARTRAQDLVVRWGGDEFVVVMPGASLIDGKGRKRELEADLRTGALAASLGLAAYGPGLDLLAALKEADTEMYRAKAAKKGGAAAG